MKWLLEPGWPRTLLRRCISIPTIFGLFSATVLSLPALVPSLGLVDLVRQRRGGPRWLTLRAAGFGLSYLACEVWGIVTSFMLWLGSGFGLARRRFLHWNFRLQVRWGCALKAAAMFFFSMEENVIGLDRVGRGPRLVFMRHSSLADTVLPVSYLSHRLGMRLRWVLKRPLLWDPCLDIVGSRLPNCFVRRGSGSSAEETLRVGALGRDLEPDEGVLIYPEGTRFTQEKRARFIAAARKRGDARDAAWLERLQHSLLPQLGGTLALLGNTNGAAEPVDVVFCTHSGFESAVSARALLGGELVGQTFTTEFWRVPRADVPNTEDERVAWLYGEWQKVDAWVAFQGRA